jgi:hypothetical protein
MEEHIENEQILFKKWRCDPIYKKELGKARRDFNREYSMEEAMRGVKLSVKDNIEDIKLMIKDEARKEKNKRTNEQNRKENIINVNQVKTSILIMKEVLQETKIQPQNKAQPPKTITITRSVPNAIKIEEENQKKK